MPRRWVRDACPQASQAGLGEDRLGAAGVDEAGTPLDEAVGDEPVDQTGHAALAQDHPVGQLAHPHPATRRLGDVQQGVVLGEREVMLGAQVLVQAPRHASMGLRKARHGASRGSSAVSRRATGSVTVMAGMLHLRLAGTVRHRWVSRTGCGVNDRRSPRTGTGNRTMSGSAPAIRVEQEEGRLGPLLAQLGPARPGCADRVAAGRRRSIVGPAPPRRRSARGRPSRGRSRRTWVGPG